MATGRDRAVVLGGSLAGLLSARVLAATYADVVVVERDDVAVAVNSEPRRGVPQGRHAHGLLAAGLRAIEDLLPGTTDDVAAAGVPMGDMSGNVRMCPNGRRLKQADVGLAGLAPSRPFLENYVRSRVAKLPNVDLRGGTDIVGLVASADSRGVTGARVQRREATAAEVIEADLVVDATGRGSRTPRWLTELGYEQPPEERLDIDLTYTTRTYRLGPAALGGDIVILIGPTLTRPRGGVIQIGEDNRAIVTLFGILGDQAPTDDEGFLAFAKTLPIPDLYEAIRVAEPIDRPVLIRFPGSVRHRYDKLRRFPAGLLVIGDAVCSFNPMYGQGMSVSAVEATILRDHLAAGGPDWRRFFAAIRPVIDVPWQISVGADKSFPDVPGRRTVMDRVMNRYIGRLHAAAERDALVSTTFARVSNLIAPMPLLLRPDIMVRVLARGGHPRGTVAPAD
ncbi:FAD-binding monooxygenase [Virgisporangium ochraceum]|uniref:FAD-binding monooxygenase n=1 Tax=Virgisporangium ochraceum TaxID=65505 RepID=A0A8J4A0N8_9ACTN|nr:FAD-dependent monooxygenase [Virgisporangium ochraceum]GIJ72708.1 FAD-binding monooxygenase [Virgisporangium ochraceum]